jgi:hypothetical protein
MATLSPAPKLQFFTAAGVPLVGGKLYSYQAGTTTPLATYTSQSGATANTNPVILDSRGEANVWLGTASYKFALYTSTDVLVWTVDNVGGFATLAALAASGGSSLVGFLQAGTGAVATTVQSKLRERVSVKDFGAAGDGVTDDTAEVQAALNSGAKIVQGVPGATYLVSHAGTVTVNSTAQRYCLLIPAGVVFDLNGSTVKAANASNSSPVMLYSVADSGVINGVIDCNKSNQTTPATGEIAGIYAYGCTRPIISGIRATNCRMYAGRFLASTGGYYTDLWCTGSDADGWSFGIDGGFNGHIVEAFIDNIYAENCTQVYGGGYQGNPVIFTIKRCVIGKVIGKDSSAGIKIQDSSADSSFASLTFIGQTNGSVNSGVKVQGNGAGLQPTRIKVAMINVSNAYGNGLYIADTLSVEVAEYHGLSNGTGAGATGSDKYDVDISTPAGGRVIIGAIDSESPGALCGRVGGSGVCKIGTFFGVNPTGIGLQNTSSGETYIDDLRITDSGSTMTYAFRANAGKGRIRSIVTNKASSTSQSRVTVDSTLYDWTIDSIRLGSASVLEGVVQLTNGATSTSVVNGHIFREYVGGASEYFQPIVQVLPMQATTAALGQMRVVATDVSVGTGFDIKYATAAGATDFVVWKVLGWKTLSRSFA